MKKVEVEILGLSSSPSSGGAYALLLKETFGVRRLPIIIGAFEAQAIALELEGIKPPRPLTHDLLKNFCDHLGATVLDITISDLKENTFYAEIHVDVSSIDSYIDSRPSDAIALAIRTEAPIYVSEKVMEIASFVPSSDDSYMNKNIGEDEIENEEITASDETKIAALQEQLRKAIEEEDYERAAKLRDKINEIRNSN